MFWPGPRSTHATFLFPIFRSTHNGLSILWPKWREVKAMRDGDSSKVVKVSTTVRSSNFTEWTNKDSAGPFSWDWDVLVEHISVPEWPELEAGTSIAWNIDFQLNKLINDECYVLPLHIRIHIPCFQLSVHDSTFDSFERHHIIHDDRRDRTDALNVNCKSQIAKPVWVCPPCVTRTRPKGP